MSVRVSIVPLLLIEEAESSLPAPTLPTATDYDLAKTTKLLITLLHYYFEVAFLPEFQLTGKKMKINPHEIEIIDNVGMGTLSTYAYVSGSINYLDGMIENLESVSSQNPAISGIIVPTIEGMKLTRNRMVLNRQELVSTKKEELDGYKKSVQDYERIINNSEVKESDLQDFFSKHPFIINQKIKTLIPQKPFGGEEFPDFTAVLHNGSHVLIEIEKPIDMIYTRKGHPSANFSHAEQQIRDFLQWAIKNKQFLRDRDLPNISVENTKGLVIIGMSKNLTPKERSKLEMHNFSSRATHEIKTFDEILAENQQVIIGIREQTEKIEKK